jgi:type I restriction enzyme R subunit
VLFASAVVDYDYIMNLIANFTQKPERLRMDRDQLIGLIQGDAKFLDESDDIAEYIRGLEVNKALDERQIKAGYERFKKDKTVREIAGIAATHGLKTASLQDFVDEVQRRRVFDGEQLSDLMAPLGLGWKERTQKELELVKDLAPLMRKLAKGGIFRG